MKRIIILAAIITSCSQSPIHTKRCVIKKIEKNKTSTIQEFDPYYTVLTDCGWLATKNRDLEVGDSITIHISN